MPCCSADKICQDCMFMLPTATFCHEGHFWHTQAHAVCCSAPKATSLFSILLKFQSVFSAILGQQSDTASQESSLTSAPPKEQLLFMPGQVLCVCGRGCGVGLLLPRALPHSHCAAQLQLDRQSRMHLPRLVLPAVRPCFVAGVPRHKSTVRGWPGSCQLPRHLPCAACRCHWVRFSQLKCCMIMACQEGLTHSCAATACQVFRDVCICQRSCGRCMQ